MAKQRNTYAKRSREIEKKQRADEKRERRKKRAERIGQAPPLDNTGAAPEVTADY
jgi:hypothetical protein